MNNNLPTKKGFFDGSSDTAQAEAQEPEVPSTFTFGGKEYSQDEAERLIGLGSTAAELEEKYNTSIDGLYPAYTKTTQELADLKRQREEFETQQLQSRAQQGQLSQQEQEQMGKQILKQWGVKFAEEDDASSVSEQVEGYLVARDALNFTERIRLEGKPEITPEELIREMGRTGLGMEDAYKSIFPTRLAQWENERVRETGDSGFYTQTSGAQSARNPEPVRVTRDNIEELADKALSGEL